jgi:pyrroline-5-carboxylate reductase
MRMSGDLRFAILGAGNIGRILLERLLASGVPVANLVICDSDAGRASAVENRFGVRTVSISDEAICAADAVLVAVPPKVVPDLLGTMGTRLRPGQLVISFAAALSLSRLESLLPPGVMVVRVMPNAPSLVGQGMNPVAYGNGMRARPKGRALVEAVLACLGETIQVSDDLMNWCVGLSGAAMRSLLPVLEGMIQAGVEAGLPEKDSRSIAAQVMLGTAALVLQTELSIDEIKALTPMQTVDEEAVRQIFLVAARGAQEKMVLFQEKMDT